MNGLLGGYSRVKHLPGCLIYVGCTCFEHACENEDCMECTLKAELNREIDEKDAGGTYGK